MALTDQELVRRVAAGDEEAFAVLHARYEGKLRNHLLRILRDAHTAEDLLQETFFRLWTRAGQYAGRGHFEPWIRRVATNLALNQLRSMRRRRERPLDIAINPMLGDDDNDEFAPAWMIDDTTPRPDIAAVRGAEKELLWSLVDRLPEGKRKAVRLVYEAELSVRAAAEALQVPEGTIKSRLHHAARALARELRKFDRPQGG